MSTTSVSLRQYGSILCILIGVGLVICGSNWKQIVSPRSFWGPEQAQEYTEASRKLKQAATREDRRVGEPDDPALIDARAQFDRLQTKLDRAIAFREQAGKLLSVAGIVFVIVGAWLYWTNPRLDASAANLDQ